VYEKRFLNPFYLTPNCDIIHNVKIYNTFFKVSVLCAVFVGACDLQPKISSIPDSIGMFIEDRYPALLADPQTQPEIYNSAVTDYGVYASPELYGSANIDDYVLYASVDDYVLVPEPIETQSSQSEQEEKIEQEIAQDYLIVPVYGGNTILDEDIVETKPIEQSKTEITPIQDKEKTDSDTIIVVRGDTVYSLARKNNMSISEFAKINNLHEPYTLSIGQKLTTRAPAVVAKKEIPNVISQEKVQEIKAQKVATVETIKPTSTKRVDLQEITVAKGDTLYSLSRKYEIPVNDLAVMNKLNAPFNLSVGQKLKVPKMDNVQTRSATEIKKVATPKTEQKITPAKTVNKNTNTKTSVVTQKSEKPSYTAVSEKPKTKISSDPKKELPKITSRSSSKFSWPVRGKILSGYGPKQGGLVNDGINISAPLGTAVRAAENGVVAYAGNEIKGMGNLVIIQHSDGWMTVYAHLNSMNVKRGNKVSVGQQIGTIGKTGKVDAPQLHFEIRKGTKAYNPTQYLKK